MSDTLITVDNVSKKFCRSLKKSLWYGVKDMASEISGSSNSHSELRDGEFWANKDISFELKRGETLGLIGHNGAGKTTLLRMLNGLIKPDKGRVEVRGRMQALIALGAGFNPILSGRENVYVNAAVLGIPKAEVDRKFDEIVEFSGISEFIDAPVQSYSSGMAVRLGFAVAANMEPDILLVDEVLAVGDEGFQSKCLNKIGELKKYGTAIILVSHNMHTISTFSHSVMLIHKGCNEIFTDVPIGIREYRKLCSKGNNYELQKVVNGNDNIEFHGVIIPETEFNPGDDFKIGLKYRSKTDFNNVDVDLVIYSSNDHGLYFQATNKSSGKEINLCKGDHELQLVIHEIPINNASALVAISIWAHGRSELLFWWRIPIKFNLVQYSTGNNYLKVSYSAI